MRRVLLAFLTAARPSEIQFMEANHGKPRLITLNSSIEFSSSHSGDLGIIVTGPSPLGVDIEALERPIDYLAFAEHCFTDIEQADIRRARGSERRKAFFNCWTGKEAYVKAIGVGLSKSLRSFAVRCAPNEPSGLRWDNESHTLQAEYSFLRYTNNDCVVTVVVSNQTGVTKPAIHALSLSSLHALKPLENATGPNWLASP